MTADVVGYLVATASRAPSIHNTQPWTFRYHDNMLDLRADPSRGLHVADPNGRELMVSCGAALYTLKLGIRQLGLEPRVRLFPDADDPQLLAQVTGLPGAGPNREESQLFHAITRRHTHRGRFLDSPPSPTVIEDLRLAARLEGARLTIIPAGLVADHLVELAWTAETQQGTDIAYQGELIHWVTPAGAPRRDGVPTDAYADPSTDVDSRQLPARNFDLGGRHGTGESHQLGGSVLAVLVTDGDGSADWLRAGEALQRVLLGAAANWVFATFATQPLEIPEIRHALRDAARTPDYPQMLFRLGRATTTVTTTRRPVREILDMDVHVTT
jgi:hypothetical protein